MSRAKFLQWSVGWQDVLQDILVTYPITRDGVKWYVRSPNSLSFSSPDYKKVVKWAVDDFVEQLYTVAARATPPRLAGIMGPLADDVITEMQDIR